MINDDSGKAATPCQNLSVTLSNTGTFPSAFYLSINRMQYGCSMKTREQAGPQS